MPDLMITSNLIGTTVGGSANAMLERSSVVFALPDGDDRDHDSQTSIQLKKQDGRAIAGEDNVAPGRTPAPTARTTFQCRLQLTSQRTSLALVKSPIDQMATMTGSSMS